VKEATVRPRRQLVLLSVMAAAAGPLAAVPPLRSVQIETLYRFNRKFAPAWQPRYLAVESPEELPRVALATLRAEGLLSLPWQLRRRHSGGAAR
jgi:hypothetical protein